MAAKNAERKIGPLPPLNKGRKAAGATAADKAASSAKAAKAAGAKAAKATKAASATAAKAAKATKAASAKAAKAASPAAPASPRKNPLAALRKPGRGAQQSDEKAIVRAKDPVAERATELMTARLFFTAAFPTIQVLLDDDPKLARKFARVNKVIQFGAKDGKGMLCCTMTLANGKITSVEGPAAHPDLTLTFGSVEQMNALLKGGLAVPTIKGDLKLLADFLPLLMGLKIMAKPNADLKTDAEKRLKVKMSLYMITRALSKYNKLGDPDMVEFCLRQPERIYQFAVDDGPKKNAIACYLRVAQGKSKSGHGIYERRTPFVLFHFFSIEGALKVLGSECEFVEGVEKGYVETVGSPEYACYLNDYMAIIQGMMM